MPGTTTVSVVYVNYNTADLLLASLRSLVHLGDLDLEVIVVDNASVAGSLDPAAVAEAWPGTQIVWSEENLGFGRGCNLGAEQASSEVLWFLNTDTLLTVGNGVAALATWLAAEPAYGAATPLLVGADGRPQVNQVGRLPSLGRMLVERGAAVVPALHRWAITYGDDATRDVEDACAAALLVRSDVFSEVGGFDRDYFFFLEDTDLCTRIGRAGRSIRHDVTSTVTHLHGQSVASSVRRKGLYYDGLQRYFSRWRPGWEQVGVKVLSRAALARMRAGERRSTTAT